MSTNQKLILVAIMSASYLIGAQIWFNNGLDKNDFFALTQQVAVALSLLFGTNFFRKGDSQ